MKTPLVKMKRNSGGVKTKLIPIKPKPRDKQYIVRSGCCLDTEINRLWVGNSFIDVTLACDGHQFQCHRLIVAASSRLLESLLRGNTSNNPIVILPLGVRATTMKSLIEFMYRGEIIVTEAELRELIESAQLLQVAGLYDPTTQFQEYFADVNNDLKYAADKTPSFMRRISQTEETNELGNKRKERYHEAVQHKNIANDNGSVNAVYRKDKPLIVDLIEVDDSEEASSSYQEICVAENSAPNVTSINAISGNTETCDKSTHANLISDSNAKCLTGLKKKLNLMTKTTTIQQTIKIKPISKKQQKNVRKEPLKSSSTKKDPAAKLVGLFDSPISQPTSTTKLISSSTIPWTYITIPKSDDQMSQIVSTRAQVLSPISKAGSINSPWPYLQQQGKIAQSSSARSQNPLLQVPLGVGQAMNDSPINHQVGCKSPDIQQQRLPLARIQAPYTIINLTPATKEVRPISPQMPPLQVPPKRALESSTDLYLPPTNGHTLPPLQNYSKLAQLTAQEIMASPSQIAESVVAADKPVPSFLRFNSSSMAISIKKLGQSREEEKLKVVNMATEAENEMDAEPKLAFLENYQEQEYPLNTVIKTEAETMELGVTTFTEADFPNFYAMMKKEKDEQGTAKQVQEKEEQMLTKDEAMAAFKLLTADDVEKIICQPSVSYYGGDDNNEDVESKVIDVETGMCIDYDRLVAEIYTEDEEDFKIGSPTSQGITRQESDIDDSSSIFYPPEKIPLPKIHERKHPSTLLPLSVMHAKQFFYNQKFNADEKEEFNFKEDLSNLEDADFPPVSQDGDPHSSNVVVLRNPRCNQPRHYSTESLYNALMAVKYGESIYRASRLHDVPRKTLRNWMKRFGIKSVYPMPKQLKDAAKNTRKKQTPSQNI